RATSAPCAARSRGCCARRGASAVLDGLLRATAARHPERTAIVQGERRISWRDLAARVAALAGRLEAAAIRPGDRVGLVMPNAPEFAVAFFAIARARAVAVPLNPTLSPGEIAGSLLRLGPVGLLAGPGTCARLAPALDGPPPVAVPFGEPETDAAEPGEPRAPFAGDVLVQASSGSTGLAKCVCRSQANLAAEADGFGDAAGVGPSDVILGAPPLFHAHGLANALLAAVRAGATLVLLDRPPADDAPDPPFALRCGEVLDVLEREGVTLLPGVPFMFDALAVTGRRTKADLSKLRLAFSAGNFLPERTYQRFREAFGVEVHQLYGCSEAGAVTLNLESPEKTGWYSVGRPLPGMEIEAPGTGSEIRIRSAALGRYLEGDTCDAEGWFATGDLGRIDEAGRLWITGRTKLFIDSGGQKVDPVEVEDTLVAHPDVREAAVVGVPDPRRGEEIRAFVVAERPVAPQALVAHCRERLAPFKVPRRVELRDALPRSPLGKLLRGRLIASEDDPA
ncbi:MAG TPA: AMP-binding protein, partial [Myxococcota bacterium]|nr:AMP-binding protein [Myxococcota bacterium]